MVESVKKNKELIPHNELSNETKKSFGLRTITSFALIFICIPCIFLGSWYFFALMVIITGFCAYEIVKASSPVARFKLPTYIITFILLYVFVFWIFIKNNLNAYIDGTWDAAHMLENSFDSIEISVIVLAIAALIYFFLSFLDDHYTIGHVFYYFGMTVFVGICLQSVFYLRYAPYDMFINAGASVNTPLFSYAHSAFLIFYLIVGVCLNDIGAYLIGIFFGKHKINPRISPKKTWEGFIGGYVISFSFSFMSAMIMAGCGYPMIPALTIDKWYLILIISLIMPFIAFIGDFIFSAIKRYFAIKDFGELLKGHGGMLDRLDSILFTAIFVASFVIFINNGYTLFV